MNKFLLFSTIAVFSIGCAIRAVPTYLNYPYPIGYDIINYYIPLADKIDFNFVINQYEIYPFLIYITKTLTFFPDPHILMIGLSSITYGIFSISIYLFLQGLNIKLDWLMTIFIYFKFLR